MGIVNLPKSLNDITLEQWVAWHNIYGKDLQAKLPADTNDEDAMILYETEFALKHYAHYSGTPTIDIDAVLVSDPGFVVELVKESSLSQAMLFREMCDIQNTDFKKAVFIFDGRQWHIVPPVYPTAGHKLSVGEFEKCQDIALTLSGLQDGRYEAMYELCAQYLQTLEGLYMTHDQLNIIGSLSLHAALSVKSYISQTINLFNHLARDRTTVTS